MAKESKLLTDEELLYIRNMDKRSLRTSYEFLNDLPKINNVVLKGNKTSSQLGLQSTLTAGTNIRISADNVISSTAPIKTSDLINDVPFLSEASVSNKVDKITSTSTNDRVYIITLDGIQSTKKLDVLTASGNLSLIGDIPVRDSNGLLHGNSLPTKSTHLTNKTYVDNSLTTKQDKLTAGENITITEDNVISANSTIVADYTTLTNKPKINNVELVGDKSLVDLGINIPTKTSELTNDSGFLTEHQDISGKLDKSLDTENVVYTHTEDGEESCIPVNDFVKDNVVNNNITLTSEEKVKSCTWLGSQREVNIIKLN